MTNRNKRVGDGAEREAVTVLLELLPPWAVVAKPMRKLGAGRREDTGDLHVLPDGAIQVKRFRAVDLDQAIRQAAAGAEVQAAHGGLKFGVGMVPMVGARADSVRWLAVAHTWPGPDLPADELAVFGNTRPAVAHARNNTIGVPRPRRIAVLRRAGQPQVFIAPVEAWVAAYLAERQRDGDGAAPPPVVAA